MWDFARGCMRTYLILADKARRFDEDPEIQEALRVAKVAGAGRTHAPGRRPRRAPVGDVRRGRARGAGLRPRAPGPTRHGAAARGALVPLVVGVDSSTSACKVQVRDAETGTVVASGRARAPPPRPATQRTTSRRMGGGVPRGLCAQAGLPGRSSPSPSRWRAQQHGLVVLDDDGDVLRPAKLWNDTESAPDTECSSPLCPVGRPAGPPPAGASPSRASPSPSCTGCAAASPRPWRDGRRPAAARLAHLPAHRPADHRPGRRLRHRLLVAPRGAATATTSCGPGERRRRLERRTARGARPARRRRRVARRGESLAPGRATTWRRPSASASDRATSR